MNATVITETGEILTLVHDLGLYQCHACREAGLAAGFRVVPEGQFALGDLDPAAPMGFSPKCPGCGRGFELVGRAVVYVPDEDELPALCCIHATVNGVDQELWQLAPLDRGGRAGSYDPVAALNDAIYHREAIVLDEISDERLVERWGRALNVGALWSNFANELDDTGAASGWVRSHAAPGMWLTVKQEVWSKNELASFAAVSSGLADGEIDDPDAAVLALAQQLAGPALAELEPVVEAGKTWGGTPLHAAWAAPVRDRFLDHVAMFEIDLREVRRRIDEALARYGLEPMPAPPGREDEQTVWVMDRGVRADIDLERVAQAAALHGATLAQAATAHVLRRAWELNTAINVIEHMRTLVAPEQLDTVALDEVFVGERGFINVENILIKTGWDSDKACEAVERMLGSLDPQAARPGCTCGEGQPVLHLRSLEEGYGHVYQEIEDYEGSRFALMATLDCDHAIAHVPPELIAKQFGDDLDAAFERGAQQMKLKVHARLVCDAAGEPRAAIASCESIASFLVRDELATTLGRLIAPRLHSSQLWAFAPFTNVVVCLPVGDDNDGIEVVWRDAALEEALRDPMIDSPGKLLGFVAQIDPRGNALGRVAGTWHESSVAEISSGTRGGGIAVSQSASEKGE
jgi:hypothetical protein